MSISKSSGSTEKLINKAEAGQELKREEIIRLLTVSDQEAHLLFAAADRVRKEQIGDEIFLRGIMKL